MATTDRRSDVDVGAVVVVGIVGTLVLLIGVVALQAFFFKAQDQQYQEAYAQPILEVKRVKSEQLELLSGYLVPEPGKGRIRIPIERAIQVVAREGALPESALAPANTGGRQGAPSPAAAPPQAPAPAKGPDRK